MVGGESTSRPCNAVRLRGVLLELMRCLVVEASERITSHSPASPCVSGQGVERESVSVVEFRGIDKDSYAG
jgi:hypothetical protein